MNPEFKSLTKPLSNCIDVQGKKYLYFGGTAYLGIPQYKEFIDLYMLGVQKFGLNNGTSRNNNIQLGIYNEAEAIAAERFGAENALITSSGYLAAQLTVKSLSCFGEVVYAPNSHPAVWLDKPNTDPYSFSIWANHTVNHINSSKNVNWVLITNSMNNLFPEVYDFNFLKQIDPKKKIILIVDDSHGIGVNNNGLGVFSILPKIENIEHVVVSSMAKALGVDAGLVLASSKIIKQLKETNEFLGASPPAAAGLYAFIQAGNIYRCQLEKLEENIVFFTSKVGSEWAYVPGFPVFLIHDEYIAENLLKKQILISSFPYPNVNSRPLNRIVLSSWHQIEDIKQLVNAL